MKKVSSAVLVASLSMLAQQAQAASPINIDTSKVSEDMSQSIQDRMSNEEMQGMLHMISLDFAETVKIDGKSDVIDIEAYFASTSDSNGAASWSSKSSVVSYVNCHSACHGSRGWR